MRTYELKLRRLVKTVASLSSRPSPWKCPSLHLFIWRMLHASIHHRSWSPDDAQNTHYPCSSQHNLCLWCALTNCDYCSAKTRLWVDQPAAKQHFFPQTFVYFSLFRWLTQRQPNGKNYQSNSCHSRSQNANQNLQFWGVMAYFLNKKLFLFLH